MSETLTCAPGDYDGAGTNPGPGITYSSDGDLTLEVTDDSDHLDVFDAGINVTGNGSDGVFWDSSAFVNNDIRGTDGVVLDYSSGTGAIGIDIGGDIRAQGSATHAIRAVSGSGDVAVTTGGTVAGGQFGIQAETGGTGALTVTASGAVNVGFSTGVAAIDATTGTGLLTVDIASGSGTVHGRNGNAILADSGADIVVNIASSRTVQVNEGNTALDLTAVGDITVNNDGSIAISNEGSSIRAVADTFTLNNSGSIAQDLDLNAVDTTVNNTGSISSSDITVTGDTLLIVNDGSIGGELDLSDLTGSYTFNNNAGATWSVPGFSATNTELGAGALNNAGTISFGTRALISAPGTTFTGTGDSLLVMRVNNPARTAQTSCSAITVAACLDLTGGTTTGQTAIRIDGFISPNSPSFPLTKPAGVVNSGIVLVDVSGGASADEHFVLDPGSSITKGGEGLVAPYDEDPVYGPVLDTGGLADYTLLYNPDTQQHILASVPTLEGMEYAAFGHEALSVWHTTSDVVAGRQADLRDGGERGGWVRVFSDNVERDAVFETTTHGNTFAHDRSYDLNVRGIIVGSDITAGDNHVFGAHLGFMATRLEHDDTSTVDETVFPSSSTFGVYGGWWNDSGLTLDGTINANLLDIEHDPSDGQEDSRSNALTLGARVEAGWRVPFSEMLYVQPLLTAAYARADIENLDLRFYDMSFEDTESRRAALGVRLGGDTALADERFSRVKYWLTARAWEEYAEDGRVEYKTSGDPLAIEDDISEGFEEVGLGVSLTSPDENLEVFLSGNVRSGDQTDGSNVTIGARLNW